MSEQPQAEQNPESVVSPHPPLPPLESQAVAAPVVMAPHPQGQPEVQAVALPPVIVEPPVSFAPIIEQPPAPVVNLTPKPIPNKVKANFTVDYPLGQSPMDIPAPARGRAAADPLQGILPMYREAAQYINGLANDPSAHTFRIHVIRRRPATYNGFKLGIGSTIEELEPMPVQDIKNAIIELHGGGDYQLQVVSPAGQLVRQLPLHIEETHHAPKVPTHAVPVGFRTSPHQVAGDLGGAPGMPGMAQIDPELASLRKREQRTQAETQNAQSEHKLKKIVRQQRREDEEEIEREERKQMLPQLEFQKQVDAIRSEMRVAMDGVKDLVLAMNANKKEDTNLPLLLETIKQSGAQASKSSDQTMQVLITMIGNLNNKTEGPNEAIEAMKMVAEGNRANADMQVAAANKQSEQTMALFTSLLANKLAQPQDQLSIHQKATDAGWTKAMEVVNMFQGMQSNDDAEIIDGESGFFGNMGNVLVHGINRALNGLANGGGSRIAEAIRNVVTPPPPVYESPAVYEAQPQQQQPQLQVPPPVVVPQPLPQPQPQGQEQAPVESMSLIEGPIDEEGNLIPQQPAPAPAPAPAPVQPEQQLNPPAPVVAQPMVNSEVEEDLRAHVTEAMRQALGDFSVGRKSHDWADYAIDKWHHRFKVELANAPDDASRVELIGSKCEVAVFSQVQARLAAGTQDIVYFMAALHALLQDAASTQAA